VALQRVLRLDVSYAPVHNQLGLLNMKEAKQVLAPVEFEKAIALDPQYAEAKNNLGVLMRAQGENARQRRYFEKLSQTIRDMSRP
jgi:Tfp pilus assembly protein PilF